MRMKQRAMTMTDKRAAVDLHVHSSKSDGSLSPSELVDLAVKTGLKAIALTDHDTTDGIDEALAAAEKYRKNGTDITVIPGVELSTAYRGESIHIVGLMIDRNVPAFQNHIRHFIDQREERNRKMCGKLREHGIDIDYETLVEENPDCVITRPHYAKYMLKHGYVSSVKEAFERYIGDHAPCYVKREKILPKEGVKLVLAAGGIPVLAHPLLYGFGKEELGKLVRSLKEEGLVALEAIYSSYSPADQSRMTKLAEDNGLLVSGGSDFHGETVKPGLKMGSGYGNLYVPCEVFQTLKDYHRQHSMSHSV